MMESKNNFCKEHNKQFKNYVTFKQHMFEQHGGIKRKGDIQCVECGKFYKNRDCLRKHKCKKPEAQPT